MRRVGMVFGQTLFSLAVVLFFSAYGYHTHNPNPMGGKSVYVPPSVLASLERAWQTLVDTFERHHLESMYWGVQWSDIWISLRLLAFAMVISMMLGIGLAILQTRVPWKPVKRTIELLCGWMEAIPEALYVILTAVASIYLIQHYDIRVPVFPALQPNTVQTVVPAIAISLPAGLYVWRMLTLQFRQEMSADYVRTSVSKGASPRRSFYRHVMPNVLPALWRAFQAAATIVLSTALFVEFYMEYQGALFHFTDAVGWNLDLGTVGEQKLRGVPSYQVGLTFEVLTILVVVGTFVALITSGMHKRVWDERTTQPSRRGQFRRGWLWLGGAMLFIILVVGSFPHLVTSASPTARHPIDFTHPNGPPFPPSPSNPFGTDAFGRDLLARALYGTWNTLWPAVVTAGLIVFAAASISALAVFSGRTWLSRAIEWLSEAMSSVPVLPVLFLALYDRNWMAPSVTQTVQYLGWILLFELGRATTAFRGQMREWSQFGFMEGVVSIGRTRFSALWTHLRSWLGEFSLQYGFSQFARILSLMTLLSAFHIYVVERVGYEQFSNGYPPPQGFISGHMSWFQMIGDATNSMAYVSYPYLLYAPTLALLVTTMGANFIAKGLSSSELGPLSGMGT